MADETVKGIVSAWLEQHGYTALRHEAGECGCSIDDLMPCDCDCVMDCQVGYWREPETDEEREAMEEFFPGDKAAFPTPGKQEVKE